MIGKKIRNPAKGAALPVRVQRLADYIDSPERAPPNARAVAHAAKTARVAGLADYARRPFAEPDREKCIHGGARGFQATARAGQKTEMLALAEESAHSKDPINHYVLSWRAGEQPTPAQVENAVDLFLDEMGLNGHQALYGLHVDTDNIHLHLMINRVHPITRRVVEINKGFDLEALHRAVARIEHAQGWPRETHGRYRVQANGTVRREGYADLPPGPPTGAVPRAPTPAGRAPAAERIAAEEGAPLIRAAASWADLHARLAAIGLRYTRQGSGALLWVGETAVKASRAGRECRLRAVERRLGAYDPAGEGLTAGARAPEPDRRDVPRWAEYHAARAHYQTGKRDETRTVRDRQHHQRTRLSADHREQRDVLYRSVPPGGWHGHGAALNIQRSLLAARQATERIVLREQQQRERALLRARWGRGFPGYAEWLAESAAGTARRPRARLIVLMEKEAHPASLQAHDLRAFVAVVYGRRVDYRRADAPDGVTGFVDRGREIVVHAEHDRDTVRAALQLAAQKWGAFQVEGDAAYRALCTSLAAEYGFKLGHPDPPGALQPARRPGGFSAPGGSP